MTTPTPQRRRLRFDSFEVHLDTGELRKGGIKVRLQDQPFQVLRCLLERPGELVTREELREKLWGNDTFVDFDHGLNAAINRLRECLCDSAEVPKFIETLPRRGYRFVAEVERLQDASTTSAMALQPEAVGRPRFVMVTRVCAAGGCLLLAAGLFWWRGWGFGSAPLHPIQSLAVLPLQNLSGDPSQDFFAEGLTDELTTNLAKISSLRVISRTSAMQYAGHPKPVTQIARELNVDAVIEGSFVRSQGKVRITAQLIDARRDVHLWAQSYERELGEILNVQDSIALDIAAQVNAKLSAAERQSFATHRAIKPEAYEAYLRGRNEIGKQKQEGMKSGAQLFQRAIDLDPLYAAAYAGLADSYSLMANYGVLSPNDAFPRTEAAARKALELDPSLGEAHASLAFAKHHFDWDWSGAESEYQLAIQLAPGFAMAHLRYAEFLSNAGRHDEAIREITRAQELDPLSPTIAANIGRVLFYARRYDQAILALKKIVVVHPDRLYALIHLGMAYEQKHMYPEAIEEFKKAAELMGGVRGVGFAHACASAGQVREAKRILADVEKPDSNGNLDWVFIAGVYAALGEKDKAFAWLDKGYENRDFFMTYVKVLPFMDPLRSDPRFNKLLRRVGFPN